MGNAIKAIYEDGVIKPLQKVSLKEHEIINISISKEPQKKAVKKSPAEKLVGIFDSGIGDLSKEHDSYLYGWKKPG